MPTPEYATAAEIQTLFDRIAPSYDQLNQFLSLGLHHIWKGMTVQWAQPPLAGQVLDLCCGSGDLALQLARCVGPQGQVWGLDFAPQMLAQAQERAQRLFPNHHFSWQQGDALDLPFVDGQFASVTMGYGLRNVTDIPLALGEIWRVLQPGGRAAILDFQRSPDPLTQQLQQFYCTQVVVPLANTLGLGSEYAYILPSLAQFPTGEEQLQLAAAAGFAERHFYSLYGGQMGVLVVRK
ncbi:MAG: bifunctional demethylmenaquinone methyltransferase/2-methoxy-6-polyprenyl-1,4-benzoquinol methylase UbiE [Cyanobacteria bacterium P01_G01_bin.54]